LPDPTRRIACAILILTLWGLPAGACKASPKPSAKSSPTEIAWRPLGSWSGQGKIQTESFTSDTGAMRVRWSTTNETPPGTGTFQLTINSAISGRPLLVAVDERGMHHDTAYIQEDPRVFFAVVDSANLDWSFTIEEAATR